MARIKKMSTVTNDGSREEQLENLARILAQQIDQCATNAPQLVPQLSKQYRETIRELEEIRGVIDDDDEINKILAAREVNGKPGAVR